MSVICGENEYHSVIPFPSRKAPHWGAAVPGLAKDAGLTGIIVEDMGDGVSSFPSRWVLMARDADVLSEVSQTSYPDLQGAADPDLRLWTDDYSNLIEVMH